MRAGPAVHWAAQYTETAAPVAKGANDVSRRVAGWVGGWVAGWASRPAAAGFLFGAGKDGGTETVLAEVAVAVGLGSIADSEVAGEAPPEARNQL